MCFFCQQLIYATRVELRSLHSIVRLLPVHSHKKLDCPIRVVTSLPSEVTSLHTRVTLLHRYERCCKATCIIWTFFPTSAAIICYIVVVTCHSLKKNQFLIITLLKTTNIIVWVRTAQLGKKQHLWVFASYGSCYS